MSESYQPLGNLVAMSSGKSVAPGGTGPYPVYGSNGLIGGRDDYLFDSGCIVGRVGAYCGSVELSLHRFWASDNTIVVTPLDTQHTSTLYLYYALKAADLNKHAGGAAQPLLTQRDLLPVTIYHPEIQIQHKIAAVLSGYDDLIDNNNHRLRLLEEVAQRIYREWFIDFRYPGHESVPLVDSELGPIPEGWGAERVGDHATVIRGRAYRGPDVVDEGGIPFVNLKCIAREGGFRRDGIKRYLGEFKDAQKVQSGDIVMAVTDMTQERRIVARAARVPDVGEPYGVFSMDLVKIAPKDVPPEYLLGILRYSDFPDRVKGHANGANVLHLHPDRISDYVAPFATLETARHYASEISPAQHLSDTLQAATERLRATRDLLLPRLMSGDVDVADLNIALPDVAA